MNFYEFVSLVNFILPTIAMIGYGLRISIGLKTNDTRKFRLMLPMYMVASFGASFIYLFNVTGWWVYIEPDFEHYSRFIVRPYFTYLGSLFLFSAWIHPELHPIIIKIKEALWIYLTPLFGRILKRK